MRRLLIAVVMLVTMICTSVQAFAGDTHGGGPTSGRGKGPTTPEAAALGSGTPGADSSWKFYRSGLPAMSADSVMPDAYYTYGQPKDPTNTPYFRARVSSLVFYFLLFGEFPFF